ncbi:MAG: hypothetical protein KA072_02160 [Thermoanaerobaculaceae bacterium]|nr:hypothetical protein [Thermoanaerobaculaceae bacterium]MDI9621568.1 hypothetical protein [Acidobacteriota bacterium]
MTTPNPKLEREEDRAFLTCFTPIAVRGRQEGGAQLPFTSTPMSNVISTRIPVYQPTGRLAVPPDDVATLRAIVEDEGGTFDFEETKERGFIFGDHRGLPVYRLGVSVPDGIDADTVLERLDPAVKAMIRRNLAPVSDTQPA